MAATNEPPPVEFRYDVGSTWKLPDRRRRPVFQPAKTFGRYPWPPICGVWAACRKDVGEVQYFFKCQKLHGQKTDPLGQSVYRLAICPLL